MTVLYNRACWRLGLEEELPRWWEKQNIPLIVENDEWVILWDHTFTTDRSLEFTRPDIVFDNKQSMEVTIVEIGICCDQNLQRKMEEKRSKYVKLAVEISKLRQWRKWTIITVVAGVTGIIDKNFEDGLKRIPGVSVESARKLYVEIQKIVLYSAVNIIGHVLNND